MASVDWAELKQKLERHVTASPSAATAMIDKPGTIKSKYNDQLMTM